jgi:hypothetical protein
MTASRDDNFSGRERITKFDKTLGDGGQFPGCGMTPNEAPMAQQLDRPAEPNTSLSQGSPAGNNGDRRVIASPIAPLHESEQQDDYLWGV